MMLREKAQERRAREWREWREQSDRERRDRIAAVVAEFNGEPTRMAVEILFWRRAIGEIADAAAAVQRGEPFCIIGAGPRWHQGLAFGRTEEMGDGERERAARNPATFP
jgi:hypothetical protein